MNETDARTPNTAENGVGLQEDIKRSLDHIDADLPPEVRKKVITQVAQIVQQRTFAGPFPPPEMIDDYERHHPGFLKDLMGRSYEAQLHEQALDLIQLNGPLEYARRGQYMGLAIVLGSIIGVCVCAYFNQSIAATVLSITGLSPIIGHFISNPLSGTKEHEKSVGRDRSQPKPPAKSSRKRG